MLDFWFNLPVAALFAVLAAVYVFVGVILHLLAFRSPAKRFFGSLAGVAPPLFAVVGLLFGLLTGFLAADISSRAGRAERAVGTETNALYEVRTLSIAAASDMPRIRDALRDYVRSVLQDEWPTMQEVGRNARTEEAFARLLHEVAEPLVAKQAGQAVQSALLAATSQIGHARSERLTIGTDPSNTIKWLTVLALGMITQLAIGLVHVERPRAQITALSLFTSALVIALGLMALQEWPFSGPLQVRSQPLQEFLKIVSTSP